MSSAAIYSQIVQCRQDIVATEQELQKTEDILAEQKDSLRSFISKRSSYESSLSGISNRAANVASVSNNRLAKRYTDEFGDKLSRKGTMVSTLDQMDATMTREITENEMKCADYRSQLANLRSRLSSLEAEYQAALRREAEEAAAAAAAAANQ